VVYARGFVPPQLDPALPLEELTLNGTFVPQVLLSQHFAFITSSFHKTGAVIEQAVNDLIDLVSYFRTLVPRRSLRNVFLIGASEGGLPVMRLIERQPRRYDGALALCASVAGAPEQIQYAGDFRVVFDYFFPGIFPFGAFDVPPTAFQDWDTVYAPAIFQAMLADLQNGGTATAQLFSVTGAAVDTSDPGRAIFTAIETTTSVLFYSVWGTNDLITTTGGVPYDNRSTVYTGSFDDAALNAGVERIEGDRRALNDARRFYQTTGRLRSPVVTLHNTLDPIVPFGHELNYGELVARAGASQFLIQIAVDGYGHCEFSLEDILAAFELLVQHVAERREIQVTTR
jgi:pimeloyl-ACP methyl ester carboxylesterase